MRHHFLFISLAMAAATYPCAAQTSTGTVTPAAASAPTVVPALVPYAGMVEGKFAAGETTMTFLLFKEEQGGEPLWTESQMVEVDAGGHYKVQLGASSSSGLPLNIFSSGEGRWLEIQIAGEPPQRRVLLTSVPYAMKAADAATLGGLPASAFALAGTVPAVVPTVTPTVSAGVTPDTTSTVTTTGGTSGYLSQFSGTSTIIDSPVFVSGSNVGVGIKTPSTALQVLGTTTLDTASLFGPLKMNPLGTASTSTGQPSQPQTFQASAYNTSVNEAVPQTFAWQAVPLNNDKTNAGGALDLLFAAGTAAPSATGLAFGTNGIISFAAAQTFPGTLAGVTAGTGLVGGGTTGDVTLSVNSAQVPLLSAANTFTGAQKISNTETVTGNVTLGADLILPNTASAKVGVVQLGTAPFLSNYGPANTYNVFVGDAGNFTTTGTGDIGTGLGALGALTSGTYNTGNGFKALNSDTTGASNTAVGAAALRATTTGGYNTAVGWQSLQTGTTGSNNTAIGANSEVGSTALSGSTAIGANAVVSQSNSLVLGATTQGKPGTSHVNVGIGTDTPRTTLEAAVNDSGALGPVLTLTNSGTNESGTSAALDFNTYAPSTSGTYNPAARIEVQNDEDSGDIVFLSNTPGAANQGLQTNMIIKTSGAVGIGTNVPDFLLRVEANQAYDAIGAFGTYFTSGYGTTGLEAYGGDTGGVSEAVGGPGAYFFGGDADTADDAAPGMVVYGGYDPNFNTTLAAEFGSDIDVDGTTVSVVTSTKIDHPLDPANKYLVHSSVQSSEMMNMYTGNVTTDELGLATVTLPDWFEAENADFRYQLTVIGQFAQAIIKSEITGNKFVIMTNASHVKVSWQVTAVRQDAYAKAHPLVAEQLKPANERGFYRNPELFGQPRQKQTEWGRRPQQMQRMEAHRAGMKARQAAGKTAGSIRQLVEPPTGPLPKRSASLSASIQPVSR